MDKKQEIINSAFELFCEKGYHLCLSELAAMVGIKTPSLYSHYNSKDQILELMIYEEINRYFNRVEEIMMRAESKNCKETLKSHFFFIMDYFKENKRLRFWRTLPLITNERLKNICSSLIAEKDGAYYKQMQKCFLKGIKSGELRPEVTESALYLYLMMIQGMLDGMLLYPKGLGENALAKMVFEAYWDGIRASRPDKDSL